MKSNEVSNWVELAVAGLLAAGTFVVAKSAVAADAGQEQCAGVVRAGMNDCATSSNACHSHVETDANPEAWIYLPKGTCAKIAGAKVVMVVDPTPANKP
jgi:uncharacterized membrane protein